MQKTILTALISIFIAMTSYAQQYKEWDKYNVDVYTVNEDQNPSMWAQMVLKEVNGVFYKNAEISVGKYRVELRKVKNHFFRINGSDIYLDIKEYLPHQHSYSGILDIDPMIVNSPYDNSPSCVGTIERFYLQPEY